MKKSSATACSYNEEHMINSDGNAIFTPFQLTQMPETGFREHLNLLCSNRRLQVVHHGKYTLFVDRHLNIRAAIAAAGIYEIGIETSDSIQQPKYFVCTDQFSHATPDLLRSRIFIQIHVLNALGKFRKITSRVVCGLRKLHQSMRNKYPVNHPETRLHTNATQWHTVRLTV